MNNIAFIPLRGGSLSIPFKNIKLLGGRPLVYYVIDAADACSHIDTIVVSTDSDVIRDTVRKHPSKKIMLVDRSPEVSTAEAPTISVVMEFTEKYQFSNMVLIQATSPLLQSEHLDEAFRIFPSYDSLLSAVRRHCFIWSDEGKLFNSDPSNRPRRQDWNGVLIENGAFYMTSREALMKTRCLFSGKIGLCEMPPETELELDEPEDWLKMEFLLKKKKHHSKLSHIKMVLSDCDGTLTDSGMYYSANGEELKKFNTRDGHAFQLLNEAGIITGIITGENTPIVTARGAKIKAKEIHLGIKDKLSCVKELAKKYGISLNEIAFIGDDLNDLSVISELAWTACPADAVAQVKECVHYIASVRGGEGAVREAVEYFLANR